jgi:hypothetical protein
MDSRGVVSRIFGKIPTFEVDAMNSLISTPHMRRASVLAAAILLAACITKAQSIASSDSSFSSSQSGLTQTELAEFRAPALLTSGGSSASPGGSSAGQYGSGGGHGKLGFLHNRQWTFEAGGGFNAPIGNDTDQSGVVTPGRVPVITWGANFTGGGGLRFNKWISALVEYQFMDNKLPAALLAAVNNATDDTAGITAGNTHINSITGSPVIDLFPKKSNGIYLVGGWGWYHKSTNFQSPELEISYYGEYEENVTVDSFTSNQWGGNAGFGLYHRLGNMYGDSSHTELFAEARYTFLHTPPATQTNGLGTTELIPVTLGIRF